MASAEIEDFNPEEAIILWLDSSKRRRRPNFSDEAAGPAFKARKVEAEATFEVEKADDHEDAKDNVEEEAGMIDMNAQDSDEGDDEGFDDYHSDEDDNEMSEAEVLKRLEEMEDE